MAILLTTKRRNTYDGFIAKYNSNGSIQWVKTIGGSDADALFSVSKTNDGNYVAVGQTGSILSGGNKGLIDAMIVKFDTSGNIIWLKTFGGSSVDIFSAVVEMPNGDLVAGGRSNSTNADLSGLNKGSFDGVLVKFNSAGVKLWTKDIGGTSVDGIYSVVVSDNDIIVSGVSSSNDSDFNGKSYGGDDIFVARFGSDGVLKWLNNFGGTSGDSVSNNSLVVTKDGGFLVTGFSSSNTNDMLNLHKGSGDAIVLKLTTSGNKEWIRAFGGSNGESFSGVVQAENGDYYIVGSSQSSSGDLLGLNKGLYDAIIVKYDFLGTLKWAKNFGGTKSDYLRSIEFSHDDGLILCGNSASNDFDFLNQNKGGNDGFILKINKDGTY